MPDRHEHDTVATVGDENKSEVGRMVGQDEGYAEETGAEARAKAQESEEPKSRYEAEPPHDSTP